MQQLRVQDVSDQGILVVPSPADYDSVSANWVEAEYRIPGQIEGALVGFWRGEPGSVSFDSWPYTEVCVVVSGRVGVESAEGELREYTGGQAFVVPRGFRGTWHTFEPTTKYFVGIDAAYTA